MDDTLHFDVYLIIGEADVRVEHESVDSRISVQFRNRCATSVMNQGSLWMTHPETVIRLGRQLVEKGIELAVERMGPLSETEQEAMRERMLDVTRARTGSDSAGNEWASTDRVNACESEPF